MFKNLVSNIEGSPQQGIFALPKVKMAENKFGKTWKQKSFTENISFFGIYLNLQATYHIDILSRRDKI